MKNWIKRNWGLALWMSFLVIVGIAELTTHAQKPEPAQAAYEQGRREMIDPSTVHVLSGKEIDAALESAVREHMKVYIEQHCRPVKDTIKCDK